jgi:hypothetical protein
MKFGLIAIILSFLAFAACSDDDSGTPNPPAAQVRSICLGFEAVPPATALRVLDSIRESNVRIVALPMQWTDGSWSASGTVTVGNEKCAGHLGQELHTYSLNTGYRTWFEADTIVVNFGYRGGDMDICVNDDMRVIPDVEALQQYDGSLLGGCSLSVRFSEETGTGTITLRGGMQEFSFEQEPVLFVIGGRETCIDNVCFWYTE